MARTNLVCAKVIHYQLTCGLSECVLFHNVCTCVLCELYIHTYMVLGVSKMLGVCGIACTYMVLTVPVDVLVIVLCLCEYNMLPGATSENIIKC